MSNRRRYYNYRHNRNKKFLYYCHHGKPFFYHKKYKKNKEENVNTNILLIDEKVDNLEPVNKITEKNCSNLELEFVPKKKQEEIVLPKIPFIRMALGIIILVALVFSISYAYFNYYYVDTRQADITMGEVYVRIPENTANISLTKMYPRTDTEARSRNDNYFDFTINSKNTSSTKVLYYEMTISDGAAVNNKVRISRDYIKVDLQEKINDEYTYILEGVSLSNFVFNDAVSVNTTTDVPREFRLRLWMSDAVLISDTEDGRTFTQAEFANLYATYHIEVNAVDRSLPPICTRVTDATKLHTEECNNPSTTSYCKAAGYVEGNLGTTITYGNAKSIGNSLAVGDAFDCDVNGNGVIDEDGNGNSIERFYYVSPYYNTNGSSALTFDDSTGYATLIYYRNFVSGSPSDGGVAYAIIADIQAIDNSLTTYDNWHGPVTAVKQLPTTNTWSNVELKTTTRAILAEDTSTHNATVTSGGTLPTAFSYAGKAARLLTAQEVIRGCGAQIGSYTKGELSGCNFLFEGTKYSDSSKSTYGPWFETPHASQQDTVWFAYVLPRYVSESTVISSTEGVRPVIDVPFSRMKY